VTLRPLPPRPVVWPLLPVPDDDGRLDFATLEDGVRDMIRVILLTRPGEQLMRPEFGAGLQRFLEQPNTVEVRRRLRDTVAAALTRWEPRIAVDEVEVAELPDRPTVVRVQVTYRIRRTGAARALALTVPLRG
jgi:uncharacterized protein